MYRILFALLVALFFALSALAPTHVAAQTPQVIPDPQPSATVSATVPITGTGTPVAASTAVSETTIALEDDFSTCSLTQGDDDNKIYRCENGEYSMLLKKPQVSGWVWYKGQYEDFVAEVDGRVTSGGAVNYGLIFRRSSSGSFYIFSVMGDRFYLGLHSDRLWTDLVDWTPLAGIQGGNAKNRLKVVAQGPEVGLYINDQYLGMITDSALTKGNIGFLLANDQPTDQVAFSNLRISTINRRLPWPDTTPVFEVRPPIPAGMGGVAVYNYFGDEAYFTIDGKMHTIPPNGKVFIHLPPGEYPTSGTIAGKKLECTTPTCSMQIREGRYALMTFGDK